MGSRFSRSEILYGSQKIFEGAKVALCGVGAVGSFAAEALARLGVGEFELFDFDVVEESNINRQIIALTSTLGKNKAELMSERILDINPSAKVKCHSNFFIDGSNALEVAQCGADVVADAIDSLSSKISLIAACKGSGVSVVSSMGAARRRDPSKIFRADISKTFNCPLASKLRKGLRERGICSGVECVFSSELPDPKSHIVSGRDKVVGSSPIVTGIFGLRLAELCVEEILSKAGKNF